MKDYVKLTSTITIDVPCGLQHDDFTNYKSDIPNRMNIQPNWPKMMVTLKQGTHWYTSMILEWPVIKVYLKDGRVSISSEGDKPEDTNDESGSTITASSVIEKKEELEQVKDEVFKEEAKEEAKSTRKSRKSEESSLDALAE